MNYIGVPMTDADGRTNTKSVYKEAKNWIEDGVIQQKVQDLKSRVLSSKGIVLEDTFIDEFEFTDQLADDINGICCDFWKLVQKRKESEEGKIRYDETSRREAIDAKWKVKQFWANWILTLVGIIITGLVTAFKLIPSFFNTQSYRAEIRVLEQKLESTLKVDKNIKN